MKLKTLTVGIAMSCVVAVSCGVPDGDDTFQRIEDADVPLNLAIPSTTTTTTTTVVAPTTTTTVADASPEIDLEPAWLYFLARDELRPIRRSIETGFANTELIALLAAQPDPITSPGLDTLVVPGLVTGNIDVRRGVATVDINQSVYRLIPTEDQTSLFAQIVLTLTRNAPGVGEVTFTFDGIPDNVPTQNNILRRNVTFDDYARLIADVIVVEQPPESTTTIPEPEGTTTTVAGDAEDAAELSASDVDAASDESSQSTSTTVAGEEATDTTTAGTSTTLPAEPTAADPSSTEQPSTSAG